jgi:ribosome-associated protein
MQKIRVSIIAGRNFENEFVFNASRSSGPGGQHVNKVSTRIELRFDITASQLLLEEEKNILMIKLANRITKEGILILVSQSERSQFDNKTNVIEKFYKLIEKALTPPKKRKPTHRTASSNAQRLMTKRIRSEKKKFRKIDDPSGLD